MTRKNKVLLEEIPLKNQDEIRGEIQRREQIATLKSDQRVVPFIKMDIEGRYEKFCKSSNEVLNAYAILKNYIGTPGYFYGPLFRLVKGRVNRTDEFLALTNGLFSADPTCSRTIAQLISVIAAAVTEVPADRRVTLGPESTFWRRCVYIALRSGSAGLMTALLDSAKTTPQQVYAAEYKRLEERREQQLIMAEMALQHGGMGMFM